MPDLARGAGADARLRADLAVAACLFWMGRFADARGWLPDTDAGGDYPGWILALRGEREAALARRANAMLGFFLDAPELCLREIGTPDTPIAAANAALLRYWAQSRLGGRGDEAAAQGALATLRRLAPCEEARGMAIYAVAAFQQHPIAALPHLDHALDLFARFGLHYLEARLFGLKARALDASGLLADAGRFQRAAAEAERRQGLLAA